MRGLPKPCRLWLASAVLLALAGCSSVSRSEPEAQKNDPKAPARAHAPGEPIVPPFAVRGELDGLLLVWFDAEGSHTATRRSEIPEAHRGSVRVASLASGPAARLDPEHVFVADVREPLKDGSYPVWKRPRAWFDAQVEAARGAVAALPPAESSRVTLYSASWCGACRSARAYMRSRSVPFEEKDIEKDAAANAEMLRKVRAAGKTPRGVPVIDFRGHIVLGFDQRELDALIERML